MNATNPFQVPAWAQLNHEQRRRERFKKTVIIIVAATVVLLVGLLIEGCKTEQAAMSTAPTPAAPVPPAAATPQTPAAVVPAVPPQSTPISKVPAVTGAKSSQMVYVVKSGDTLSRIAKAHRTTVKAIEAANGLNSDRILVGAKLTIPEA